MKSDLIKKLIMAIIIVGFFIFIFKSKNTFNKQQIQNDLPSAPSNKTIEYIPEYLKYSPETCPCQGDLNDTVIRSPG